MISIIQYKRIYNEVSVGMTEKAKTKIICDSSGWNNRPLSYGEPTIISLLRILLITIILL